MEPSRLLDAMQRVRARLASDPAMVVPLDLLRAEVVALSGSEAGCVFEIPTSADATPPCDLDSLVGDVVRTGSVVICNEPGVAVRNAGFDVGPAGLQCFLGLPLRAGGRLVGVAAVANRPGGYEPALADRLEPLLATCADAIALVRGAADRRRAEAALERRREIDALVLELSHHFLEVPAERADAAIEAALARIARFTGADRAALDLLSPDRGRLLRTHAVGAPVPEQVAETGQSTSDLPEWAIRFALDASGDGSAGSAAVAALPAGSPVQRTLSLLGVKHVAWLIARVCGEPVGAIVLTWMHDAFDIEPADLAAMSLVADILTAAERRKQSDRALRESEGRFRMIADAAPLLVWASDADGRLHFVNRFGLDFAGLTLTEVTGRQLLTPVHPDDVARLGATFIAARDARRPFEVEFRTERSDGQIRALLMCGGPVIGADGALHGFVGSSVDITDRKRLEDELTRSQKLEAVGRLAGGIAHDFNNLLTAVLGHVEFGRLALGRGESPAPDLDQIDEAATRAASLTRQLLAFASRQQIEPRVVDANQLVLGVEKLLRRLLGEHIVLAVALDPEAGCVRADPGQLEQVLINLAANARDAMPAGGHLHIETAQVVATEPAGPAEDAPTTCVRITVRDTGTGMDATTLQHVFEPFFTTKGLHQGTGLGLATCYGIVKQSRGQIAVWSEVGAGTTFEILLPAVAAADEVDAAQRPSLANGSRGQETVLLVEDEPAVRRVTVRMLRQLGYRVLEAADGLAAEAVFEAEGAAIDLLVTDIVMPQRSGLQLAAWAQSRFPKLRVLLISGYTESLTRELEAGQAFLAKPFTLALLAERARQVLERSTP